MRLRWLIGAAAFLCACAGRTHGRAAADDSLLQRMLVAEDARGTGAEGIVPLLEGQKSSDSTLRFVANRALERLKWAPSPPPPAAANRPPRAPAAARPQTGSCSRLLTRLHDSDLRVVFVAIDSLATCSDNATLTQAASGSTTLIDLATDVNDNVRAAAISRLARSGNHDIDSIYIKALSAHGYQVVLAGANALKDDPHWKLTAPPLLAVRALFAALERLTAERRENSRDERVAILDRISELGKAADAPRLQRYLADFDSTVAKNAASTLTKWNGAAATAHPVPLPIRPEPLAQIFRTRGMQLRITMAPSSGGGTILINLFNADAPATIARVTRLARAHYYDGLTFHRYVPNFVIQGGSPGANEQVGDAQFMRDELGGHSHLRGTVGISTRGHDTGDAQFFVNLVDNKRLDHDYTVFGEVVSGMDVVDKVRAGDVMARVEVIGGTIQH